MAVTAVGRHGRQTFDEFRPLQPESPDETDYASILQANLDLTQLFSNVHDVLYSGMGSSMKMMLAGNYVKYIDDFRRAIEGWKSIWGTLTCNTPLFVVWHVANCAQVLQILKPRFSCRTSTFVFTHQPMPSKRL